MAQSSTQLPLAQMVDLALHTPEIGVVNFNMLHTLLLVMIKRLDLEDTSVEFRGKDSEKVQSIIESSKGAPKSSLTEFTIGPQGKTLKTKKIKTKKTSSQLLTERSSKEIEERSSTLVVVESSSASTTNFSVTITKEQFQEMQNQITTICKELEYLKTQSNLGLLQTIRSSEKSLVLPDIVQLTNLTARLDAQEASIQKLAIMLEEMAKEQLPVQQFSQDLLDKAQEVQKELKSDTTLTALSIVNLEINELLKQFDDVDKKISSIKESSQVKVKMTEEKLQELFEELKKIKDSICMGDVCRMVQDVEKLKDKIFGSEDHDNPELTPEVRLTMMEQKYDDCSQQMACLDSVFNQKIHLLQKDLQDLEKDFTNLLENNYSEVQRKSDDGSTRVLIKKSSDSSLLEVMQEQITLLKTSKADREDLDVALTQKADASSVKDKVSVTQFDKLYEELRQGIQEAVTKLTRQEVLYKQTIEEVQQEIGLKVDRLEIDPLKDFVNSKLKGLQQKLNKLVAEKAKQEAAASKIPYLTNLNCLSCDTDVIMRKEMDSSLLGQAPALTPTKGLGPYIAYEMDKLRKQRQMYPQQPRNLNIFDSAKERYASPRPKGHCDECCGGVKRPENIVQQLVKEMNSPGAPPESPTSNKENVAQPISSEKRTSLQNKPRRSSAKKPKEEEPQESPSQDKVPPAEETQKRGSTASNSRRSSATKEKKQKSNLKNSKTRSSKTLRGSKEVRGSKTLKIGDKPSSEVPEAVPAEAS